ncbi:hypothetical protein V6Z12_D07G039100 [Gossypium hirsutum]
MEKGIQPRAKMLVQFMMHVTNSRVNLLPLEIKDPGIQFMTGLKWFRIIVIQGCRIRSNEAKDQILSSLGATCALMKPTMPPEKDVPPTSCRVCR